jgi:pyridoxal phosphate enzyme (YggS family)
MPEHISVPDALISTIRERLAVVSAEIAAAARRSGRAPEAVQLVAVTKTHPPVVLEAARLAGLTSIGENYLREAEEKFTALGWPEAGTPPPVQRHAIGHVQGNKVKTALRWFETIEAVDSLVLAERINRLAAAQARVVAVLLEVNISADPAKFGFFSTELEGILPALAKLSHIRVNGLMTIGSFEPNPEAARGDFIALRALRERLAAVSPPEVQLTELSMGMSHDFTVAIEEGATIVRIGSRLFGSR